MKNGLNSVPFEKIRPHDMSSVAHSKLLGLILRHDPQKAGLVLGPGGWVSVEELLSGLSDIGKPLSRLELLDVVAQNDKKRFAISSDGLKIRAAQGHSIEFETDYEPVAPPETLFHGTAARFIDAILAEGLKSMSRLYVHLSMDVKTATDVGRRHGRPIVLSVKAQAMAQDGYIFFQAENGVWLTERVPQSYLILKGGN